MEHNPKKSKALVITIIVVLLLLIVGYLLFKSNAKIFNSSTTVGKIFSPLLGTSKEKKADTIVVDKSNNGATNTSDSDNGVTNVDIGVSNGGGSNSGGNNGNGSGNTNLPGPILPPLAPIPTPVPNPNECKDSNGNVIPCGPSGGPVTVTQCSDGVDNDGDRVADINDPGCHTDFNENNNLSYDRTINDESRTRDTSTTAIGGMCPDDPLVFTEDEKAELAVLLRQYYLLAPTLRIEDDITLLDYDNQTNEELVKQATILINDCKAQKANPGYTGPQEIKDNPYYQQPATTVNTTATTVTGPEYVQGYGLYELLFNIW